jgi:hypothetical protein
VAPRWRAKSLILQGAVAVAPVLLRLLARHADDFLYGALAADAVVAKNLLNLKTFLAQLDPRVPGYSERLAHIKLAKRDVDIASLKADEPQIAGRQAKQTVTLVQGIDSTLAKKIVKLIKDGKIKVQASIQGEKVRVSGKKRDDLQDCIALLRGAQLDQPLQFDNFRD